MKALKAFIKHFETLQRSLRIKKKIVINFFDLIIFYFNTIYLNAQGRKFKVDRTKIVQPFPHLHWKKQSFTDVLQNSF